MTSRDRFPSPHSADSDCLSSVAMNSDGILEKWVSLEVPVAHGLSLQDDSLAVACSNGLVRLFRASDLRYTTTLPRPPPLGYANISSVRELHELAAASTASGTSSGAVERDGVRGWGKEQPAGSSSCVDGSAQGDAEGVGSDLVHRYPATLGCRLSPSGTKVVCVYADRGLFIWDVTDPLCVGKYRSFLAHGGRIWDVQRMPGEPPIPAHDVVGRIAPMACGEKTPIGDGMGHVQRGEQ